MIVSLDLEDAAEVDRLWQAWARRQELLGVDPELRAQIEARLCAIAAQELAQGAFVDEVRRCLDTAVPALVLEAFSHVLVPDLPALGAFRQRGALSAGGLG